MLHFLLILHSRYTCTCIQKKIKLLFRYLEYFLLSSYQKVNHLHAGYFCKLHCRLLIFFKNQHF